MHGNTRGADDATDRIGLGPSMSWWNEHGITDTYGIYTFGQ